MSIDEAPHLDPVGLTESTKFLGFTVVAGYERLLGQLTAFDTIDRRGDPRHPVPGAGVISVPYDFRRGIVEAAERLDAMVGASRAPGRPEGTRLAGQRPKFIVPRHNRDTDRPLRPSCVYSMSPAWHRWPGPTTGRVRRRAGA
jgi:hypothetical protein